MARAGARARECARTSPSFCLCGPRAGRSTMRGTRAPSPRHARTRARQTAARHLPRTHRNAAATSALTSTPRDDAVVTNPRMCTHRKLAASL
eukprot:scaffold10715_cov114-Isochrysis_galbana.AAC.15